MTRKNRTKCFRNACFVIAEAGSNHNGDIATAKKLILAAARAGADAIKFQLFMAKGLSSESKVQKVLMKHEFKRKWLRTLNTYAKSQGIIFLATPFDEEAADLLADLDMPFFKIASGDLTNFPLVEHVAHKYKPIILSVGLASLKEIKEALNCIYHTGNRKVALLHCVVNYPARVEDVNLRVMPALAKRFALPVGFSDHTLSTVIPAAAVSLGARIIEKHFTLSRKMNGPDHPFALQPEELKVMIENIRTVERSMGIPIKRICPSELPALTAARRSLYTRKYIFRGSVIPIDAVTALRPQITNGILPKYFKKIIGARVKRDIRPFEPLHWKDLYAR